MRHALATWIPFAILTPHLALAQSAFFDQFSLRLAKAPDAKDADKPATLAHQRNDGGTSDYLTQGSFKADRDFAPNNVGTISPFVSWNRNTLASSPTKNWSYGANVKYRYMVDREWLDWLVISGDVGQQRDLSKTSKSMIAKLGATTYGWPQWKKAGVLDYAYVRPTAMAFTKHVSDAAPDKTTGIAPTGTMSGALFFIDAAALIGRWSFTGTSQALRVQHAVSGDSKATHRLHTVSLGYQFVDSPTTGTEAKASQWIPGIAITRQVGDDPLNAIARAGFTQIAFTLKY